MYIRLLLMLSVMLFSLPAMAFDCYYTLVKDSCWLNYDVSVDVMDANTNKVLITVVVPKGKSWIRQKFSCQPAQKLMYIAKFSPIFWQDQKDKTYKAIRYWFLPGEIGKNDLAWNIPVCFSRDFSSVPFPPDAEGQCICDFKNIPAIETKQS